MSLVINRQSIYGDRFVKKENFGYDKSPFSIRKSHRLELFRHGSYGMNLTPVDEALGGNVILEGGKSKTSFEGDFPLKIPKVSPQLAKAQRVSMNIQ